MYEKLPNKMKQNAPFCLWRKRKHKGQVKKIPYQINGKCLSSTERTHFSTFDTVMEKVSEYDGIGIGVFDGFCAIDIDHCHYSHNEQLHGVQSLG